MGIFDGVLLTVDYDRTLTDTKGIVPERNLKAIRWFMENGGRFTVNTGRSIPMSTCFRDVVPVNAPLLLYNGSAAYDVKTGEFTKVYPIELDGDAFTEHLQQLFPHLLVEIQGVDRHYSLKRDTHWELFSDNGGCGWGYAKPSQIPGPFLKTSLYGDCSGHCVASMYQATEEEMQEMLTAIDTVRRLYGDYVEVFHPCAKIVDIHAKGVSKLRSARDLQKAIGRKILVCVGDAENDLTMMEGADYAFCPADGIVADRYENVCPCDDGAVADVIYKKIPEILGICLDNSDFLC